MFTMLETLEVEIEAVLNDRPLTHISTEADELELVTPSHLLYGRKIVSLPHPTVEEEDITGPDYATSSEVRTNARKPSLMLQHY